MAHMLELREGFQLNYDNLMADRIGALGIREDEILKVPRLNSAINAMRALRQKGQVRGHDETVLFTRLPYQAVDGEYMQRIRQWGKDVRQNYRWVVSLGIGGSFLGNQVLLDAGRSPYWNNLPPEKECPRIFFAGNNVDPATIHDLDRILSLPETMFIVISKSGTTTETMAAFLHFYQRVTEGGLEPARHFTAVTDPEQGLLLEIAREKGFPVFQVPRGVGGRWSVLSDAGLMIAEVAGLNCQELLQGARQMDQVCQRESILENPGYLYAVLCNLFYRKSDIHEVVLMPYCDALKSFAQWYVQLLAESLGKERDRKGRLVHEGRTPIAALGTTDMHAQTQQHREGRRNKLLTTIAIRDFGKKEIRLPTGSDLSGKLPFIAGQSFSHILDAARRANEEALAADGRPSCCVSLPCLSEFTLGQLFYFFEIATAFEGELLNVNAFNQPGVEHYKKIMKKILDGSH
ncbi:MAG: glucose-6-phosphate isomerase [Acidobacteria bacterium]|nr:glucose-6-phosphate isomerase [Acidobacteriota bacterium]